MSGVLRRLVAVGENAKAQVVQRADVAERSIGKKVTPMNRIEWVLLCRRYIACRAFHVCHSERGEESRAWMLRFAQHDKRMVLFRAFPLCHSMR